jgi:hypothetical protein
MIQEELNIEIGQFQTRAPEHAATPEISRKTNNFPSQTPESTRIEENHHGYG